jgi:HEAT repeat protein
MFRPRRCMGAIGDERSREALIRRLDDPQTPDAVRKWCALGLGETGNG